MVLSNSLSGWLVDWARQQLVNHSGVVCVDSLSNGLVDWAGLQQMEVYKLK